jgi:hypothetical protein
VSTPGSSMLVVRLHVLSVCAYHVRIPRVHAQQVQAGEHRLGDFANTHTQPPSSCLPALTCPLFALTCPLFALPCPLSALTCPLCRTMDVEPSLTLTGTTLLLPAPELELFRAQARENSAFVLQLQGGHLTWDQLGADNPTCCACADMPGGTPAAAVHTSAYHLLRRPSSCYCSIKQPSNQWRGCVCTLPITHAAHYLQPAVSLGLNACV